MLSHNHGPAFGNPPPTGLQHCMVKAAGLPLGRAILVHTIRLHPEEVSRPTGARRRRYSSAGWKSSATELMQYRRPVVARGPSSKTWPKCAPQRLQRTSVRTMPCVRSSTSSTYSRLRGSSKLGQPVPESNLASEEKRGWPQAIQAYVPVAWL